MERSGWEQQLMPFNPVTIYRRVFTAKTDSDQLEANVDAIAFNVVCLVVLVALGIAMRLYQ